MFLYHVQIGWSMDRRESSCTLAAMAHGCKVYLTVAAPESGGHAVDMGGEADTLDKAWLPW